MRIPSILFSLAFGLTVHAQQTSENNPRLRNSLESHPEADANKDGVLTLEEAKAYRNQKQVDEPAEGKDHGNGIRSSYTYKTVGNDKLELFVDAPKGHTKDAKVPAIVFFHGDGFRSGSVNQFERQAKYLAGRGMVSIRVRYRLTKQPGVEVTDCVEDAISSMRWVRANAGKLGIDPERIAAGGGSAGGYLSAATLLIEHINAKTDPEGVSAKPNALVLFNPGFGRPGNEGAANPEDPEGKGDLKRYVKSGLPPMIQFFGTEDPFLPIARPFIDAYTKAGNRCDLVTYEGEGHSFFNKDEYLGPTISETDKFLTGLGWLGKKAE